MEADTERLTTPLMLFTAVTVMVEVPDAPASIWLGDTGPALIVKSCPRVMVILNVLWNVSWKNT